MLFKDSLAGEGEPRIPTRTSEGLKTPFWKWGNILVLRMDRDGFTINGVPLSDYYNVNADSGIGASQRLRTDHVLNGMEGFPGLIQIAREEGLMLGNMTTKTSNAQNYIIRVSNGNDYLFD